LGKPIREEVYQEMAFVADLDYYLRIIAKMMELQSGNVTRTEGTTPAGTFHVGHVYNL